ncbi:MAG: primosomal protein N' [Verrucomicrobiota bacterium]
MSALSSAPQIARVLIDGAPSLLLDYRVPESWAGPLESGARVQVRVRQALRTGTVIDLHPSSEAAESEFDLLELEDRSGDESDGIPAGLVRLALWMESYYLAKLTDVLRAIYPEGARETHYRAIEHQAVRVARPPSPEALEKLRQRAPQQARCLAHLGQQTEPIGLAQLGKQGFSRAVVQGLLGKGFLEKTVLRRERDPFAQAEFVESLPLPLTKAQAGALQAILEETQAAVPHPVLLQGVTGSGKTEVYLQAIAQVVASGRDAIVLVPEISLTPQTVNRFKSRFATAETEIAVLHSALGAGERQDEWRKVRCGRARIVIGARSAVFAPVGNLGLIVVDEEQEASYKQDNPPRYHARDLAVLRGHLEKCAVVLGSATPSLESTANVQAGKYRRVQLTTRIGEQALPRFRFVDMRRAGKSALGGGMISELLHQGLSRRLEAGEQAILFLNRRGFSRFLQCPDCAHVVECRHCDVSLTYHRSEERLLCHFCGYQELVPRHCPQCGSRAIQFAGYGTQKVEQVLRGLYPKMRLERVDADSMRRKNRLQEVFRDFKAGKIQVLLGTQLLAKGLHFPNVTLVGLLHADLSLHLPDFRAGERTFQLLVQVAGRAGRGEKAGEVIVQTFSPHSPSLQFARHHDHQGFAEQELELRKAFHFPPYFHLVTVTSRSKKERLAQFTLETLVNRLKKELPPEVLVGEAVPAPVLRVADHYRYQVSLRAPKSRTITAPLKRALLELQASKEVSLLVDVDPV